MRKGTILLLLTTISFADLFSQSDFSFNEINYAITSPRTVGVAPGNYSGNVVIPSNVEYDNIEYYVTSIEDSAFYNCRSLKSIVIPDSVTAIANKAFEGCTALNDVTFEGSPEIGHYAFWSCPNISIVTSRNIVPGHMNVYDSPQMIKAGDITEYIPETSFSNIRNVRVYNQKLNRFVTQISSYSTNWACDFTIEGIPAGKYRVGVGILPNIEDEMPNKLCLRVKANTDDGIVILYTGMKGPRKITFNAGTTEYDSIFIPDVLDIPECNSVSVEIQAIQGQGYTTTVALDQFFFEPAGDDFPIESYAGPFTKDVYNNALLIVPEGAIDSYQAAQGWNLFKDITVDSSIDTGYFCVNDINFFITSPRTVGVAPGNYSGNVAIPSNVTYNNRDYYVTSIEDYAFFNCGNLSSIIMPNSVTTIANNAFEGCTSFSSINIEDGNPNYSSIEGVLFNKQGDELLLYPAGRTEDSYEIPNTTYLIATQAFKDSKLHNVSIPANVGRIEAQAFEGCTALSDVVFEGSPFIGYFAFLGCTNISSVTSHHTVPGRLYVNKGPKKFYVDDLAEYISQTDISNLTIQHIYNQNLSRHVTQISSSYSTNWACDFTFGIPAGKYRVGVGILPNIEDEMPNKLCLRVKANTDDGIVILYTGMKGPRKITFNAGTTEYDSIFIPDVLDIPECNSVSVEIQAIQGQGYTTKVVLDQIFFEEVDFAGPFNEDVYDNATLYVPDGAVSAYQAADGWNLFKNIAIDDAVESILIDKDTSITDDIIIYDSMGRKVDAESIWQLSPGLFIFDGNAYLIK